MEDRSLTHLAVDPYIPSMTGNQVLDQRQPQSDPFLKPRIILVNEPVKTGEDGFLVRRGDTVPLISNQNLYPSAFIKRRDIDFRVVGRILEGIIHQVSQYLGYCIPVGVN